MEFLVLVKVIIIFLLLCFSAFFSGSETALFSLGSIKLFQLRESKHPKASLMQKLLENPRRLLISILVGNECINITASALAASLCISMVGSKGKWIAIAIMTPLILLFGEVLPKTIAVSHSEKFSLWVVKPIDMFARVIFPLRWIIRKVVDALTSLVSTQAERNESVFYEKEVKELVDAGHREGILEKEEQEIIHNIFKFNDTLVSAIMTPYSSMFTLPHDLTIEKAIKQVRKQHFSRIPVHEQEKDTLIGVLNAKDLLTISVKHDGRTTPISTIIRPPYFIAQDKKIQVLLKEFREKKIHLALVVNKDGNVIGLVTMEDLLEELFGEIYDEFDAVLKGEQ